jgi:hypothetical protein
MPLNHNAKDILRVSMKLLAQGDKPLVVTIGVLTAVQHAAITEYRTKHGLPGLISPEVVFLGRHLYKSRAIKDGYSIDDILDQIESAMSDTAIAIATHKMTALKSISVRNDRYGNQIFDEAIFELTQRRPKAELYSVIPKGDKNKPPRA